MSSHVCRTELNESQLTTSTPSSAGGRRGRSLLDLDDGLEGRSWFRINPVNFRTRLEHMDELLDTLRAECERVRDELLRDRRASAAARVRREVAGQ